ncbi:MAG: nucleotidyltransferase domain-containing protein [Oscillospiraceae bacterium]|nr:nucleotidyltransferase domain-containing protein [Oscillospiraceae bacterium]
MEFDEKIQKELDLIKESILKTVPAEEIYLFGSYAYGTPREDSDLDIYVVVPDDAGNLTELQADVRMELWNKKSRPLDLLMGRNKVFNRRKTSPTLERVIYRDGVKLYG